MATQDLARFGEYRGTAEWLLRDRPNIGVSFIARLLEQAQEDGIESLSPRYRAHVDYYRHFVDPSLSPPQRRCVQRAYSPILHRRVRLAYRPAPRRLPRVTARAVRRVLTGSRPRPVHAGRAASRRAPPKKGDPDPEPSPPRSWPPLRVEVTGSGDTDLNIVWREAVDRFESAREFETLGFLATGRARWMRGEAV